MPYLEEKAAEITAESKPKATGRTLPRNVWAASLISFFMDVSSEMVINISPLFLSNVLGVKTNIIGLIGDWPSASTTRPIPGGSAGAAHRPAGGVANAHVIDLGWVEVR